jgi:hypothetical protein
MTRNSARVDFNLSVLEDSLDRQLNDIMQELANKPNKLLLRCIKRAEGDTNVNFRNDELNFLTSSFIAKSRWTRCEDPDEVFDKFLSPWDGFFQQLRARLNNATLNLESP